MLMNQQSSPESSHQVAYSVPTLPPHSSHVQTLSDPSQNRVTYSVSSLPPQQSSSSQRLTDPTRAVAGSSHHTHNKAAQSLSPGGSTSQLRLLQPAPPTSALLDESTVNQTVFNPSIFLQSTQTDKPL